MKLQRSFNYLFFIGYQFVQLLALPLIVAIFLWRKIKGKPVFGSFQQRIGFIQRVSPTDKIVWIHAVSVGEVLATQRLVLQLKQTFSAVKIYLTVGTAGGFHVAKQQIAADYISYIPYDFASPMLMAFKRIQPIAIIAMEAEVWPNFLLFAWMRKVPVYLLNGRVNATNMWLKNNILKYIYHLYTHIYAQTDQDVVAFEDLDVMKDRISLLGNIKAYNVLPKKDEIVKRCGWGKLKEYCVLLFASMHEGECEPIFASYIEAKRTNNEVKAVFAPRHFAWKAALISRLESNEISYFLWDEKTPLPVSVEDVFKQYDVLVVCVLGKLFDLIGLADVFVLGGTFVPIGGHNLLEPAVWGVPMLVGPHYQNTRAIAEDLANVGALYKVATQQELVNSIKELVIDGEKRTKMGICAADWLIMQEALVGKNLTHLFEELRGIMAN